MKFLYVLAFLAFNYTYAKDGVVRVKDIEKSVPKINQIYKIVSDLEKLEHDKFSKQKESIQSKYEKLNANKANIAQDTFVKEMQKLEKDYNAFQSAVQKKMKEVDFVKSKVVANLTSELDKATQKIAVKKDLEKVFGEHFLMYYDKKEVIDITDDVVAEINKNFSAVNPNKMVEKLQKEFISK